VKHYILKFSTTIRHQSIFSVILSDVYDNLTTLCSNISLRAEGGSRKAAVAAEMWLKFVVKLRVF